MVLAHRFSARLGLCPAADAERGAAHLAAAGLPTRIAEIPGEPLDTDDADGRHRPGQEGPRAARLTFILTRGIGQAFIANDVDPAVVEAFLTEDLRR